MANQIKQAVFLTGAAARISQEVALLDKLMEQKLLEISEDDTLLAGFSSGSLNLLALNGCFRKENPVSWDQEYKERILFPLKDSDVYVKNTSGGWHVFDTAPLRKTLDGFLEVVGATWVSNLPFESYVVTFSDRDLKTEWATNIDGAQNNLLLSDLFMASTAIPVAFPWQSIGSKEGADRNFPNGHFSDGGTGGTFKKFADNFGVYLQQQGAIEELFIISPMRESGTEAQATLEEAFKEHQLKDDLKLKLGDVASSISFETFYKFLEELHAWNTQHRLIEKISVNIPRLPKNFGILDFSKEKEQYTAICDWVTANPSDFHVPIANFLEKHKK